MILITLKEIILIKLLERKSSNYSQNKFKWGWMPPHTGFFLKRKCYIDFGLYRLDLGSSADYELMLRMFEVHKLSSFYLPFNIVKMRLEV